MRVHFVYDEPPPGEFTFGAVQGQPYHRELHRCSQCAHLRECINADLTALYQGDYVATVWGDRSKILRTYERINALPPEQSDNVGRVSFIHSFLRAQRPETFTPTSSRLLDVGAGLGVFPYRMKQAGWECVALDMDPVLVEHIQDTVGICAVAADVTTVEGLGHFDLVTFNKVLEHTEDPISILASVKRLLRPGGYVYVELPDAEAAEIEGQNREEYLLGHIHVFSFASYALMAHNAGFSVIQCNRVREPSSKFTLRGFLEIAPWKN